MIFECFWQRQQPVRQHRGGKRFEPDAAENWSKKSGLHIGSTFISVACGCNNCVSTVANKSVYSSITKWLHDGMHHRDCKSSSFPRNSTVRTCHSFPECNLAQRFTSWSKEAQFPLPRCWVPFSSLLPCSCPCESLERFQLPDTIVRHPDTQV